MELHKNWELFAQIINEIASHKNFNPAIIEKDYYVTLFLQALTKNLPNLIFKGGTSLSKVFGVINRFSEDIDITVDFEDKLSQRQHKNIKEAVVKTAVELDMNILNLDDTRSRRDFNNYKIAYDSVFGSPELKQYILVEASLAVRSFPTEEKPIRSIMHAYLQEQSMAKMIAEFGLKESIVRVQSLDRTLIDKLFALGDYYIKNQEDGHSRHLYDIYKLLPLVKIDSNFRALVKEVREIRKSSAYCYSAQEGIDLKELLTEILKKDSYKKDYEEKTSQLLFESVPYIKVKAAIEQILNERIL